MKSVLMVLMFCLSFSGGNIFAAAKVPAGKLKQWTYGSGINNIAAYFRGKSPKSIIDNFGQPNAVAQETKGGVQIFRYGYDNMNIVDRRNNKFTRVTFKIYRYSTGAVSVSETTLDHTSKLISRNEFKSWALNKQATILRSWKRPDKEADNTQVVSVARKSLVLAKGPTYKVPKFEPLKLPKLPTTNLPRVKSKTELERENERSQKEFERKTKGMSPSQVTQYFNQKRRDADRESRFENEKGKRASQQFKRDLDAEFEKRRRERERASQQFKRDLERNSKENDRRIEANRNQPTTRRISGSKCYYNAITWDPLTGKNDRSAIVTVREGVIVSVEFQ